MTDRTPNEEIDAIYEEAREEIDAITKRYNEEVAAYLDELKREKIEKLKNEMGA